jgi:hypothetical protein
VDIIFDRLAGGFSWRREQWPNIDIETKIRKSGGNYFLSTVVSVLSNLRDQQARSPTLGNFECLNCGAHSFDGAGHADLPLVNPRNRFDFGTMSAENLFHRRRDFSHRRFDPRCVNGKCEEIAVPAIRGSSERIERFLQGARIAFCFKSLKLLDLT